MHVVVTIALINYGNEMNGGMMVMLRMMMMRSNFYVSCVCLIGIYMDPGRLEAGVSSSFLNLLPSIVSGLEGLSLAARISFSCEFRKEFDRHAGT
jgi:hypothetical protein